MEKTLNTLRPGEEGAVVRVLAGGALRRRIFDMGITPGARVVMRRAAPFGDPIEINVRGYRLSIRRAEASQVLLDTAPVRA